ncbi:MAG: hypothetical protein ACODAA_03825 [Gemmatimonadota bacterium]
MAGSPVDNPHFESPASWREAGALVPFDPIARDEVNGRRLLSLAVFVRDHDHREVPPGERALEAHYEGFVFSQSRPGVAVACRRAYERSYGPTSRRVEIADRRARAYELGPEPKPDDPDPRMPAVLAWADGDRFHLLASATLEVEELIEIGRTLYGKGDGRETRET